VNVKETKPHRFPVTAVLAAVIRMVARYLAGSRDIPPGMHALTAHFWQNHSDSSQGEEEAA